MNNPHYPTARRENLVIQEVPEEILVFDLDTNKAHCLNQTAAMVWKSCDGSRSVSEIAAIIAEQSGNQVNDDLVWLAIDQLNENKLLVDTAEKVFTGNSRREAIKKIGMASMIALPIVASLAAPRSAMASVSCQCANTMPPDPSTCPAGCPRNGCSAGFCV